MTPLHTPCYIVKCRHECDTIDTRNYKLICIMHCAKVGDVAVKRAEDPLDEVAMGMLTYF